MRGAKSRQPSPSDEGASEDSPGAIAYAPLDLQRGAFLRRCRARLKPVEVGLPTPRRSHGSGLRREDVAVLADVSMCWYTWLEQGRKMRVSDEVVERIATALRMSDDERTYLFALVQQRLPPARTGSHEEAPEEVVRLIQSMPLPATVMNLHWDILAWNQMSALMYRDYGSLPAGERNLLELLLLRPAKQMSAKQMEATAARMIARLRFDYTRNADDPKFAALIHRLSQESPLFNRLWNEPVFTLRGHGVYEFTHARYGALAFDHTSYVPDGHPKIRVVMCRPNNLATERALQRASEELNAVKEMPFAPEPDAATVFAR